MRTEIEGHTIREKIIRQSNLEGTIVRASTLTKGIKKGIYCRGGELSSGSFTVTISRADVADFMLKQINNRTFLNKAAGIMY